MFGERHWSKSRWIAVGCLGILTLWLLGMTSYNAYRRHTLPQRVASGRVLFEHAWQPGDALADSGDGLGPVFNEKSCAACHFQGGVGGGGPNSKNVAAFDVLPTRSRPEAVHAVVHASATRPELQESFEHVTQLFPVIPGGLTIEEGCRTKSADFNPVVLASINTPALFGAGLIDGLSRWSMHGDGLRRAARGISESLNADFSAIPVGRLRALSGSRVGKFGWKGQFATLEEFVASACAVELGLTNPDVAQSSPGEFREDTGAALDMTARQLDELVSYVAALPRPTEILPDDPTRRAEAIRGKAVFGEVGCADCHTPNLGDMQGVYSDFRLYDLEPEHSDSYVVVTSPAVLAADQPEANQWKTPPLWGVADSAPYFHDGKSSTLHDAILRHGGTAKQSRKEFKHLPVSDRQALLAFLGTLKAPR
jgi:CxxC motif-containing protein (DUF1111 family)